MLVDKGAYLLDEPLVVIAKAAEPEARAMKAERRLKGLRWMIALSSIPLFTVVAAFGIAPNTSLGDIQSSEIRVPVLLPEIVPVGHNTDLTFWRQEPVRRGDTVPALLARLQVNHQDTAEFRDITDGLKVFDRLVPGRTVYAQTSASGELLEMHYHPGGSEQFLIRKDQDGFEVSKQSVSTETQLQMKSGVIHSSLFAATDDADVPDAIAARIIEIFSSEIDFHKDLHKGDRFTVIYESHYENGTQTGTGKVLAIEFINQGKKYRAVYFQSGSSAGAYYTPEGKSLRKTFLRSPLEFSRISSGFSLARFHPVLNTWRAHRGVDYAAPTGTRIRAVADGRVAFSGWQGGYGNLIILQHQGKYSTAYGHLSGFARGMRKGQSVRQGDIIGYVGATGLATGPHLHYEFRVNGDQRDPLREVMPDTVPVVGRELAAFRERSAFLVTRLDMMQQTRLAFLD